MTTTMRVINILTMFGLDRQTSLALAEDPNIANYDASVAAERLTMLRVSLGVEKTIALLTKNTEHFRYRFHELERMIKLLVNDLPCHLEEAQQLFLSQIRTVDVPIDTFKAVIDILVIALDASKRPDFISAYPSVFLLPPSYLRRLRAKIKANAVVYEKPVLLWTYITKNGVQQPLEYSPQALPWKRNESFDMMIPVEDDTPCRMNTAPQSKSERRGELNSLTASPVKALVEFLSRPNRMGNQERAFSFVLFRPWLISNAEEVKRLLEDLESLGYADMSGKHPRKDASGLLSTHSGLLVLGHSKLLHVIEWLRRTKAKLPEDLYDLAIPLNVFFFRLHELKKTAMPQNSPQFRKALFAKTQPEFWVDLKQGNALLSQATSPR